MESDLDFMLVWCERYYGTPQTLGEYQQSSRECIQALRHADPSFCHLVAIGRRGTVPIDYELTKLDAVISASAYSAEHRHLFLNTEPDGSLGPHALCRTGFLVSYGVDRYLEPGDISSLIDGAELTIQGTAASAERNSRITVKVPCDSIDRSDLAPRLRKLLAVTTQTFGCSVGGIYRTSFQQVVNRAGKSSYAGQWLFYLPFPHLAGCLPSDIRCEPFHKGVLIETTPHIPDPTNPRDIAAGIRVRDVLDEFGLISNATYAIEGWPPDPEEWRYEEFISGAPPGRKYGVHCIDFDGYDADRNVLLYAKLFRRLKRHPKQWGLRGWDGPVLNEAKRQVRAAAKAGGVPIEWHIGLEEPSLRVKELLAEYTDISERQLKVIYTPLEQALGSEKDSTQE